MKQVSLLIFVLFFVFISCSEKENKQSLQFPKDAKAGKVYHLKTSKDEESGRIITTGLLAVFENHETKKGKIIGLPIKIYKSTSENPMKPVFYFEGGPGQSNLHFSPHNDLLAQRDVVLVGYRGVDGSSKIDCPEFLKGTENYHLFSKESIKEMQNNTKACLDKWKNEGIDINCYTMTDVIDDMETARKALKYDRVNLLSVSYGTRLAQIYALRYPESVFRSVMVSVNPPGHFVWSPETIDNQIEYYSKLWGNDAAYSKKTTDLAGTMKSVMHNMPKKWLFFNIDPDKARFATFMGLYHTSSAGAVFDAFIAAENGDPSGLALVSLMTDWQLNNMGIVWGDMLAKSFVDYDASVDYSKTMKINSSIMGSPGSQLFAIHEVWPVKTKDTLYSKVQETNVECLLLSGNIDFSTPAEFARDELLPYLKKGKQHILSEYGHVGDIMYRDYNAFSKAITSYYATGNADMSLFKYEKVNFEPNMSFPQIAKIAIGAVVFILLLIVGAVLLIRRRRKKRKSKKMSDN